MMLMRFLLLIALIPFVALGYESVIAEPETARVVLPLASQGTERFGVLSSFPHTYEFIVGEKMPFEASIFVHDEDTQKNDVSLIVVKQERRGVSEIGRTRIQDGAWESSYDYVLAESFRKGGEIRAELDPGAYTLEVSAPNNDGTYRLTIGDVNRGYFENIQALFEVKRTLGSPVVSAVLSPLIYVPLLLLLIGTLGYFVYKKTR